MAMDERTKNELYRINQEKLFLGVIITAVFLFVKIVNKSGILSMLGELSASVVVLIYLIPYLIIRYRYKTLDKMVRAKLYTLSSNFFMAQLLVLFLLPPLLMFTVKIFELGDLLDKAQDSAYSFLGVFSVITVLYGLIRSHNEKFASQYAAELSLSEYKKKLFLRALVASAVMLTLTIFCTFFCIFIQTKTAFLDSEKWSQAFFWLLLGIMLCFLGIIFCWLSYFYYLGIRKKLENKIISESEEI